jgi:hypothetical protein
MRKKRFTCEDCGDIQFDVTVEPTLGEYDKDGQEEWLEELVCPSCGGDLNEVTL